METSGKDDFNTARKDMFDRILSVIATRKDAVKIFPLTDIHALSAEQISDSATLESLTLIEGGLSHLKDGAPGGQPGSMASALSKSCLRRSSLATALGIRPPLFEPILLGADYSTGADAARYLSDMLFSAALQDLPRSRDIIWQKLSQRENIPARDDDFYRQMVMTLDIGAESYRATCLSLQSSL